MNVTPTHWFQMWKVGLNWTVGEKFRGIIELMRLFRSLVFFFRRKIGETKAIT